jgi:maltoporin
MILIAAGGRAAAPEDNLRNEFETYKAESEARIRALEEQLAQDQDRGLTMDEVDTIRSRMDRTTLDFEFHGYFRSGYGVDESGDAQSAFKAPNAEAKYRLGNEAETYLETTFLTRTAPQYAGREANFETIITLAYVTPNSNNSFFDATTSLREAYAVAEGVVPQNRTMGFWAGQRFYSRYDVHMNDFWYRDMSGYGGGLQHLALEHGALFSMAWIGGSVDTLQANGTAFINPDGNFNKNNLDFSITRAELPGGTLDAHLTLSYFEGDSVSNEFGTLKVDNGDGAAVSLMYNTPIGQAGGNILSAQYGYGAAYNFRAQMTQPAGVDLIAGGSTRIDTSSLYTWRIFDNIFFDISKKWSLQGLALYQESDIGTSTMNRIRWTSLGARPTYHFNRYFSFATEAGYDYTDRKDAESGSVFKLTLAPQITPQSTVFSRPAIRAFFTYAWWSDAFEGSVGVPSYKTDTQGLAAGVQIETWW